MEKRVRPGAERAVMLCMDDDISRMSRSVAVAVVDRVTRLVSSLADVVH